MVVSGSFLSCGEVGGTDGEVGGLTDNFKALKGWNIFGLRVKEEVALGSGLGVAVRVGVVALRKSEFEDIVGVGIVTIFGYD